MSTKQAISLPLSLKEAERILNQDMIYKDFWIVDGMNNNIDELQAVLETLFNDEWKNCYMADIVNNQNSSRLIIKCTVCNTQLSSYDPFISHNKGKNHKKAVQQFISMGSTPFQNLLGPIMHKKFNEMESDFEPGSLEDQLFNTKYVVLGWQFVYREIIEGESLYTCQLCASARGKDEHYRMDQKEAFNHLTQECHILQYMYVKFRKQGTFDQLFETIQEIQHMEGKNHCKIITLRAGMDKLPSSSRRVRGEDPTDALQSPTTSSERQRHSSSSSWSRTPDHVDRTKTYDRKGAGRPKTPPSPEKLDKSSQMEPQEQTLIEFMQDVTRHYNNMCKEKGDDLTEELKKDLEGQDLLIQTVKVLAQKVYLYSLTHDHSQEFQKDAIGLLKKTELLRLPHY